MLAKYAVGYLATGIAFALIDSIWLRTMYTRLYQPELGPLLGSLKLGPAVVFYLLYIAGMMWFAVAPALANGRWQTALIQGAVLGCVCYATYDLTNYATLKVWSLKVTVLDLIWGTLLTGSTAAAGTWLTSKLFPA